MSPQKSFGRRTTFQAQPLRARHELGLPAPAATPVFSDVPADQIALLHKEIMFPQADEWREREQPIKPKYKMPWRQLALMASLCFGIASFVLPESINDNLDWLLYGLMAVSAYVGFSKRFFKS